MSSATVRCASCGAQVDPAAKFCPHCGAVAPAMGNTEPQDHDLTALLVSANLLRTRRQFTEAEEVCRDALAIAPEDAGAHALMGDIFMNQDRYKDAAVWYQMALDIEPQNVSVKSKAERAEMLQKAQSIRVQTSAAGAAVAANPDPQGKLDSFVQSAGYGTVRNIVLIAGVCLFALIVLAAMVSRSRDRRLPTEPLRQGAATQPASAAREAPQVPSSSVTQASPVPQGRTSAPQVVGSATGSVIEPSAPGTVVAPRPVEQQFARNLQRADVFQGGKAALRSVVADPRDNRVFVTVHVQPSQTRKAILESALGVAGGALMADRNVDNITVRVDTELPSDHTGTTTQIAFVGDISRTGVEKHKPQNDSLDTLNAIFSNTYWSSELQTSSSASAP
ncbi:MAG: tetratricopeptide repeat protein [Armatimonadetes bacterium]|nr:tetratricopeptide repeat protein [Armatimonadota bacterium]